MAEKTRARDLKRMEESLETLTKVVSELTNQQFQLLKQQSSLNSTYDGIANRYNQEFSDIRELIEGINLQYIETMRVRQYGVNRRAHGDVNGVVIVLQWPEYVEALMANFRKMVVSDPMAGLIYPKQKGDVSSLFRKFISVVNRLSAPEEYVMLILRQHGA